MPKLPTGRAGAGPVASQAVSFESVSSDREVHLSVGSQGLLIDEAPVREVCFDPVALRLDFPELNLCHRLHHAEAPSLVPEIVRLCARGGASFRRDDGEEKRRFTEAALRDWISRVTVPPPRPLSPPSRKMPTQKVFDKLRGGEYKRVLLLCGASEGRDLRQICRERYERERVSKCLPAPGSLLEGAFFARQPETVNAIWVDAFSTGSGTPGVASHLAAECCRAGWVRTVYSLSLDGCEQKAGVPADATVEVDGSWERGLCVNAECSAESVASADLLRRQVSRGQRALCRCGGLIRPGIYFSDDPRPDPMAAEGVREDFAQCDLLILLGTNDSVDRWAALTRTVPAETPRLLLGGETACAGALTAAIPWSCSEAAAAAAVHLGIDQSVMQSCTRAGVLWPEAVARRVRSLKEASSMFDAAAKALQLAASSTTDPHPVFLVCPASLNPGGAAQPPASSTQVAQALEAALKCKVITGLSIEEWWVKECSVDRCRAVVECCGERGGDAKLAEKLEGLATVTLVRLAATAAPEEHIALPCSVTEAVAALHAHINGIPANPLAAISPPPSSPTDSTQSDEPPPLERPVPAPKRGKVKRRASRGSDTVVSPPPRRATSLARQPFPPASGSDAGLSLLNKRAVRASN